MNSARDALVGVVIIAAVVLGVGGTLWLQGYALGVDQREVDAVFTEVGQIRTGAPVKVRGVRVGRIQEITMDPDGQRVRLRLRVDEQAVFPDDPVVVLSPESMFGDWQAEIHPRGRFRHATYAEVREDEEDVLPGWALPDITQLTAEAAQIAENMAELTDRVGIAFSEETARNIAALIDNVEEVSQDLAELVAQQSESFAQVTQDFREAATGIREAAYEAQRTLQTVDRTFGSVDELLGSEQMETFLANLTDLSEDLKTLGGDLQGTHQEARRALARIDTTFVRIGHVIQMAEEGEGSLARLLRDPTAMAELEGTLVELQTLLEDIRENPRRYLRLSIF